MWKKAFLTLLSLNLLVVVLVALWIGLLPKESPPLPAGTSSSSGKSATVQLSVGPDAINTYLDYAVSQQADLKRVLSYAHVRFNRSWDVQVGVKMADKIVPCDVVFQPDIHQGNLSLGVESATIGDIPVPTGLLMIVFRHVPWPQWIVVDAEHGQLDLKFTERPQHPYGVRVLGYSPITRQLTMAVSIQPKSLSPP
ncbi:MAG: DUF2140 family protein [Alicyclobacillaceae bacterium]|nr:DUF2140 family protein [Alicyclobacillaceae bacterium]